MASCDLLRGRQPMCRTNEVFLLTLRRPGRRALPTSLAQCIAGEPHLVSSLGRRSRRRGEKVSRQMGRGRVSGRSGGAAVSAGLGPCGRFK